MASITSLGLGSGLDLNSLVTKLVALERRPIEQLQARSEALSVKVSAYANIGSRFDALGDASNKLLAPSLWRQKTATSSDESVVRVDSTGDPAASIYAVTVQALAQSQVLAMRSRSTAPSEVAGAGRLTIEMGTWSPPTGPASSALNPRSTTTIEVAATDTLAHLRDKINAADAGVMASLVSDQSGIRLVLRSVQDGKDSGFAISVDDADGNNTNSVGLSRFSYDGNLTRGGMGITQEASNALATINGINVESTSNTFAGVIEGLSFTMRATTSTPVNVTVAPDRQAVRSAIKTFADAYNNLAAYLSQETRYDSSTKTAGSLQAESAASGLQSRLRAALNASTSASSYYARMSDLGLETQRNGTLTIRDDKLDAALNSRLEEVKKATVGIDDSVAGRHGFAKRYADLTTEVLGIDAALASRKRGLGSAIDRNAKEVAAREDRVDLFQRRLIAQYTALDGNLARFNALSSYVNQQLQAWSRDT